MALVFCRSLHGVSFLLSEHVQRRRTNAQHPDHESRGWAASLTSEWLAVAVWVCRFLSQGFRRRHHSALTSEHRSFAAAALCCPYAPRMALRDTCPEAVVAESHGQPSATSESTWEATCHIEVGTLQFQVGSLILPCRPLTSLTFWRMRAATSHLESSRSSVSPAWPYQPGTHSGSPQKPHCVQESIAPPGNLDTA